MKWTHKTTAKIAEHLRLAGIGVSRTTVSRLLHQLGYSLRTNQKNVSPVSSADRDQQFLYIKSMRERFSRLNFPIISVDTKKRELVGNFKNSGRRWQCSPTFVNDHDFPSWAVGYAIPYSIYDVLYNRGSVFVGTSHDTAAFAVSSIRSWWNRDGRIRYPLASQLLILADAGGSNRPCNLWKDQLQRLLCDRFGLSVTVCHYPTGASKWNPTEHRLLCEISKNWAGQPLTDYHTILNLIRSTTTRSGLKVKAYLDTRSYTTGLKVSPLRIDQLNLTPHHTLPHWNYTLASNTM